MKHLYVLDLGSSDTIEDIEAEIGRIPADLCRNAEAFIFTLPKGSDLLAFVAPGSAALEASRRRSAGKPVYLIRLDNDSHHDLWKLGSQKLEPVPPHDSEELIFDIRRAALADILNGAGGQGYWESSPSYHFVAPSLKHTNVFLRVGDLITSKRDFERLAFWIAPEIKGCTALIVDTWSIASVALRAMQITEKVVPFDCLSIHPKIAPDEASTLIYRLIQQSEMNGRILFILSVVATGEAINIMRSLLSNKEESTRSRWVALYGFSNSPTDVDVFCRLAENIKYFDSAEVCAFCKEDSTPIHVSPSQYYIATEKESSLPLTSDYWDGGRDFIEAYGNDPSILQLHRDDPNDLRHHAFYVDVCSLLKTDKFLRSLNDALEALVSSEGTAGGLPDIVVAPDHNAGERLARLASEKLGAPLVIHNNLRRAEMTHSDARSLNSARRVLILDDVIKTGSRLEEFTRSLREDFESFDSVSYLVGVARPGSDHGLRQIEISLTKGYSWRSKLCCIEKLILPLWDAHECPWCHEYDALGRVAESMPHLSNWLKERMIKLTQREFGLRSDPFLLPIGIGDRRLGAESRVGPKGLSSSGTIFAFASALQQMRTCEDEKKRLQKTFPLFKVFSEKNLQNYSEALLRACIFRLVLPREWPSNSRKSLKSIFSRFIRSDECFLFGEFALALARRSFLPERSEELMACWERHFRLGKSELYRFLNLTNI